jgi:hypothetical protein
MVSITGGCNKCGRLIQSQAFDPVSGEIPILICKECYNRYYSLEALRQQKLNKVLRRGLKERIMEWLRL